MERCEKKRAVGSEMRNTRHQRTGGVFDSGAEHQREVALRGIVVAWVPQKTLLKMAHGTLLFTAYERVPIVRHVHAFKRRSRPLSYRR